MKFYMRKDIFRFMNTNPRSILTSLISLHPTSLSDNQIFTTFCISSLSSAGVYLIAALLELYSGALVTMTGDDIKSWLQAVSTGQKDWYTLLPLCLPHPLSVVEFSLTSPVVDWEEFTCGWAHAATGRYVLH